MTEAKKQKNAITLTEAWCNSDVIHSNKSSIVGLGFNQQLIMESLRESDNMIDEIYDHSLDSA